MPGLEILNSNTDFYFPENYKYINSLQIRRRLITPSDVSKILASTKELLYSSEKLIPGLEIFNSNTDSYFLENYKYINSFQIRLGLTTT